MAEAQVLVASNKVLQSYTLVAGQATSATTFEHLCTKAHVDIIAIDIGSRLPFLLHKRHTDAALARGLFFEVSYAPAIRTASARRNLVATMRALIHATRARGILLSSGTDDAFTLRSPLDVANLGQLLGLKEHVALAGISTIPERVIEAAQTRRARYKGVSQMDEAGWDVDLWLDELRLEMPPLPDARDLVCVEETGKSSGGGLSSAAASVNEAEAEGDGFMALGGASDSDSDSAQDDAMND
ncbi:unnamed protein product [Chrysoparadoxa australica]